MSGVENLDLISIQFSTPLKLTIKFEEMVNRNKYSLKIGLLAIALFFISVCKSQDSIKYNINDPRNPQCPCHKHQKQAEDEYRKLLASAAKDPVHLNEDKSNSTDSFQTNTGFNKSGGTFLSSGNSSSGNAVKKKRIGHTKQKRKRYTKKHPVLRKIIDVKSWGVWKELRDVSACYHWK